MFFLNHKFFSGDCYIFKFRDGQNILDPGPHFIITSPDGPYAKKAAKIVDDEADLPNIADDINEDVEYTRFRKINIEDEFNSRFGSTIGQLNIIGEFSCFDHVVDFCQCVQINKTIPVKSSLYKKEERFHLFLSQTATFKENWTLAAKLNEYAKITYPSYLEKAYLDEHDEFLIKEGVIEKFTCAK